MTGAATVLDTVEHRGPHPRRRPRHRRHAAGGRAIDCETVVVGVGVAPNTDLAAAAGLDVEDGIVVDEHLRASAPDVFAAGDVARALHPRYGRHVRVEHWANALHQGPAAARSMLDAGEPYSRLPYFFSDQYTLGMEYVGLHAPTDTLVVGRPGAIDEIERQIESGDAFGYDSSSGSSSAASLSEPSSTSWK